MHRLFIAIRPPRPVREQLLSVCGDIDGARWQSDDQLHLTLRFIGDVDADAGNDLASALTLARSDGFQVIVKGAGTFFAKGRIHTLWAGIEPSAALLNLHRRINRVVAATSLSGSSDGFRPHITLARFSRRAAPTLLTHIPAIPAIAFDVQSFGLFESTLTAGGAAYTLIERYELG